MASTSTPYPIPITPTKTRVTFIGLGVMGSSMATRLQTLTPQTLTLFARTPSKLPQSLLRCPSTVLAPSIPASAASADVVFLMLSHPADVREVSSEVLPSLPVNGVLVDMTSSCPRLAREIAKEARSRGVYSVDAPVSGGDVGAREGKLAIFAGGDEDVIKWLEPLFRILGKVTIVGKEGCGQSFKIANQIAVAGSTIGLAEALVYADRVGLDANAFFEGVCEGDAGSGVSRLFGERMVKREFGGGGALEYMVKDLGMGLEGFETEDEEEKGVVVLPGARLWREMWMGMVGSGEGRVGLHGIVKLIERLNGIKKCEE